MQRTKKTRVKIFCIGSLDESHLTIQYGASTLGLVSPMSGGPNSITEDFIPQIAAIIPPSVSSVLLTSMENAASIISQQRRSATNTVQLIEQIQLLKLTYIAAYAYDESWMSRSFKYFSIKLKA